MFGRDVRLKPGQQWKDEIRSALENAAAAILLVSADFLASDFIATDELPPLLDAARTDGVQVLPVIIKPCAFADMPSLSCFQAVNDPRRPLIALTEVDQEEMWYRTAVAARDSVVAAAQRIQILPPEPSPAPETAASEFGCDGDDFGVRLMLESELRNPRVVDQYFVYRYQHVDVLGFMPEATHITAWYPGAPAFLERLQRRLRVEGWEGDGSLRALWLPPFVGVGAEDTYGVCAWFVKQSNNGEAWIASPVPLDFERLQQQNDVRRIRL